MVILVRWNTRRMLPKVYAVGTKIIMSNDNVVCAVHVFKVGLMNTPTVRKLRSASSNQVRMCRGEECGGHSPLSVYGKWRECNAGSYSSWMRTSLSRREENKHPRWRTRTWFKNLSGYSTNGVRWSMRITRRTFIVVVFQRRAYSDILPLSAYRKVQSSTIGLELSYFAHFLFSVSGITTRDRSSYAGPILMRSSTHFAQLQKFGAQF